MSKVLQERGFGSLPSSTEKNLRDQVKSISTTTADLSEIHCMEPVPYAISVSQHRNVFPETVPFPRRLNNYYSDNWKEARRVKILEAYDHLPHKEKDLGSFTLPSFINNICFDKAFVDLGASVSVMPFSTYTNLGLGVLSHTRLTIELADMTIKQPRGIAENVLVRIGKFIFPIDFIILDIPEDDDVPLILGRPFLSTAHVKIDVFKRKAALRDYIRHDIPPPPPPSQTPIQQAPHTVSTIKLHILKKGEYDIWAMKMEHYLAHTDYPIWEVIQNGNGPVSITTDTQGQIKVLPPRTAEEILARERERKARTTLLMALPEDHLCKLLKRLNAKEMCGMPIKSRFGGNDESKKMQKYILKQQFEGFSVSNSEGLHKGYDRFQSLLSQLEIHGAGVSTEDANQKFLRSLPSAWSQVSLIMRTKPGVDSLSFDDLYNNLRVFENDVKGSTASSSSTQNVAFIICRTLAVLNVIALIRSERSGTAYEFDKENGLEMAGGHDFNENEKVLQKDSANDKFGLGYGDHRYDGILSYENEVLQSVFMNKESDLENQPLYDRFVTAEGMHVVPPPMTGNYMPSGPDIEIDYSQFTYGPKQSQPSESETQTSDFDTCESNISVETSEFVTETVVNEPKVVSQPKVWSDAPIIEEYESDSEDEHVSQPTEEQETPSFANQQVKTPRETVKNQFTHSKNPKVDKKGMAKQVELNKQKGKGSSQREIRPISTARARGTNNVSTARHNFNSQAVLTNVARKISIVKPFVNRVKTAEVNAVSAVGGRRETAVKPLADYPHRTFQYKGIVNSRCSKHMTGNKAYLAEYQDFNGGPVERITKKRTKNKAKTTKPDSEWKRL
ncbi:ribonuclease H-like domain-containing protein [Tanacetum coccineum]